MILVDQDELGSFANVFEELKFSANIMGSEVSISETKMKISDGFIRHYFLFGEGRDGRGHVGMIFYEILGVCALYLYVYRLYHPELR